MREAGDRQRGAGAGRFTTHVAKIPPLRAVHPLFEATAVRTCAARITGRRRRDPLGKVVTLTSRTATMAPGGAHGA